jgi:hypothetical protein
MDKGSSDVHYRWVRTDIDVTLNDSFELPSLEEIEQMEKQRSAGHLLFEILLESWIIFFAVI